MEKYKLTRDDYNALFSGTLRYLITLFQTFNYGRCNLECFQRIMGENTRTKDYSISTNNTEVYDNNTFWKWKILGMKDIYHQSYPAISYLC